VAISLSWPTNSPSLEIFRICFILGLGDCFFFLLGIILRYIAGTELFFETWNFFSETYFLDDYFFFWDWIFDRFSLHKAFFLQKTIVENWSLSEIKANWGLILYMGAKPQTPHHFIDHPSSSGLIFFIPAFGWFLQSCFCLMKWKKWGKQKPNVT